MLTLCMDTSHVFLALGLIRDDKVIASYQKKCWKKQSEEIFPRLIEMCESVNVRTEDIDQIVISNGPGSYTGVRIAMTIAKVFCAMGNIPLFTIGTLNLYAGPEKCRIVMDARGKRVYTNCFENGKLVGKEEAVFIADLLPKLSLDETIIGDGQLVGRNENWPDIIANFLKLKDEWHKAENVHLVVPDYLKPASSYLPPKNDQKS